jgi:hypothetical protein
MCYLVPCSHRGKDGMTRKKTVSVGLRLRFSETLRRRIERAAKAARPPRSMNAEIVARLEQSFELEDQGVLIEVAVDRALSKAERAGERAGKAAAEAIVRALGLQSKPKGSDNE